MGVKGSCRSANRGGALFYALSAYSKGASVLPAFILSDRQFSVHRGKFSAKSGKSEFFFGVLWCFLGIFGDKKCQNLNIFLKYGSGVSCRVLLWWWLLSCPLVQGSAGFRGFRTCHRLALVLLWCVPRLLPACLLCDCPAACKHGSFSRF